MSVLPAVSVVAWHMLDIEQGGCHLQELTCVLGAPVLIIRRADFDPGEGLMAGEKLVSLLFETPRLLDAGKLYL